MLAARLQDANLSRLVFSDIVRDLRGLAEANRDGDGDEIVRRLASLDRVTAGHGEPVRPVPSDAR